MELIEACEDENVDLCKKLLKNKDYNVNYEYIINTYQIHDGTTALLEVAMNGNVDICKLLLKHKRLDINYKDSVDKESALHVAAIMHDYEIVKLLLCHGAKIEREMINDLLFDHAREDYSDMFNILKQPRLCLPRWSRFYKFPRAFNNIAIHWLWCCKQMNVFGKDIQYLIVEYIAEAWKRGWFLKIFKKVKGGVIWKNL